MPASRGTSASDALLMVRTLFKGRKQASREDMLLLRDLYGGAALEAMKAHR